jgi:ABC-2 type transport system permease protein
MFLCWVFYDGLKLLGSFNLLGELDAVAQYMSLAYHYDSIKKGVIDVGDMLYFLTIIGLFIYSALTVIKTLKR